MAEAGLRLQEGRHRRGGKGGGGAWRGGVHWRGWEKEREGE